MSSVQSVADGLYLVNKRSLGRIPTQNKTNLISVVVPLDGTLVSLSRLGRLQDEIC